MGGFLLQRRMLESHRWVTSLRLGFSESSFCVTLGRCFTPELISSDVTHTGLDDREFNSLLGLRHSRFRRFSMRCSVSPDASTMPSFKRCFLSPFTVVTCSTRRRFRLATYRPRCFVSPPPCTLTFDDHSPAIGVALTCPSQGLE